MEKIIYPYYYSETHKEYEIEYLKYNNYNFISDLSYTKNNSKSIILLFEYEGKKVLRGYQDGIIFPQINYFNLKNIHTKHREKKIQEIFDYIFRLFEDYNIVNTKIYQEPYLCYIMGYSIFDLIDIKNFNLEKTMDICISYKNDINIENIEKHMEGGGTRTIINGFKKNPPKVNIYYGEISNDIFNSFIDKHINLAGKKTKTDKCWNLINEMIKKKEAILLISNDNYVLYHISKNYCYYGINACSKKDRIVTYLLYEGIKWLIKNGCNFIHFGKYYKYFNDEKNKNISKFKKSFCNKMFTQYYLDK